MPASLFSEMERSGSGLQDERALQLALELSMLGLSSENCDGGPLSHAAAPGFENDEPRMKKSQNMTECVPVPSSEHVAEIVGRQGCKIKALRAKTNTYIKTPVRGEEPVFVVTGRKEDVTLAKREILSAAEHFSQIRASRKTNGNGSLAPGPPNPSIPGQSTIQVRVPYRVVGLVVGPKGATIKRIQQQTHTYIVTPSRDKEPVFEVTGLPENVETARREIEAHIAMRTGSGLVDGIADDANDFHTNGIESYAVNEPATPSTLVNSIYKGFGAFQNGSNNLFFSTSSSTTSHDSTNLFSYPSITASCTTSSSKLPDFTNNMFGSNSYDTDEGISESPTSFDPMSLWSDLGANKARSRMASMSGPCPVGSRMQRSYSVPDTHPESLSPDEFESNSQLDRLPARRIRSAPLATDDSSIGQDNVICAPTVASGANVLINGFGSSTSSSSAAGSISSSPIDSSLGSIGSNLPPKSKRECMVCFDNSIVAALVPCGHNLFCMDCAQRSCDKSDPTCPICHQPVTQAIRIYS